MNDDAKELNKLINHAEELVAELGDEYGPEVSELRDRITNTVAETRRNVLSQRERARVKVRDVASSVDDYVREYPWLALGTGILIAATIGVLAVGATRRARPDQ